MKRLLINLFIVLLINSHSLKSQYVFSVDKWMQYLEELAEETEETEQIETLFSELSYLKEHPFELNRVTAEQLQKLPFLTDRQIENILLYRQKYGKIVTIYELKNLKELDFQTIELLLPFVYIDEYKVEKRPFTVDNLLKYGSNEMQLRYDRCFQQKKGYHPQSDSILDKYPNRQYLGEPFYHSMRYSYTFDDRLQIGFVAEKDAGEPFLNKHHKGYDYYSFHLLLKDIRRLKSLAIGDYKVSFGQGLVISNEFTPSRNAIVAQAERRTYGFRRHYSTNESVFFRGLASTLNFGDINISAFFSSKKLDGIRLNDSTFSSVKTDGLHRLPRERYSRYVLPMHVFGGNVCYATSSVRLGITAVTHSFKEYRLEPDTKPYNVFYFRGSNNTNVGVDYLLKNKTLKFYGETALSTNKAMATLNALQLTPASYISFLMLYRYYDKKYQSFFGNAFSQGSSVQNEQGLYMGLQLTPFAYWKVSAYADFFRFPWLKYGVDASSSGSEYMAQIDYTQLKNLSFYLRYKYRKKEKNILADEEKSVSILPYTQQRLRLQFQYNSNTLQFRTSAEGILYDEERGKESLGMILSQSIGWKPEKPPFQWDIYIAGFRTDDYYSRLSSYEKNILYAFTMPQLYGRGLRFSTTFRWDVIKNLSLSAKVAQTHYSDRETIGTDLEEINGNNKTDIYVLLRLKF